MLPLIIIITIVLLTLFYSKKYRWFYTRAKTFVRDVKTFYFIYYVHMKLWHKKKTNSSVANEFDVLVRKHPLRVAFWFEHGSWTFVQASNFINKVVNFFKDEKLSKGDTISLILENRPEYPCIWLALSKLGIVTCLIDTNLNKDVLLRAIRSSNCRALVFGTNCADKIFDILNDIKELKKYELRELVSDKRKNLSDAVDLRLSLLNISHIQTTENVQNCNDAILKVITADAVTGSLSIIVVTNLRFLYLCYTAHMYASFTPSDILYVPIPLHTILGGIVGVGQTFVNGSATVIRKQFSPEQYWKDCERYKCTAALYVDSMFHEILKVPLNKYLRHCVTTLIGIGMKVKEWKELLRTFNIQQVCELFTGDNGTALIGNTDNKIGACGSIPFLLRRGFPYVVVSYNKRSREPVRCSDRGYCVIPKPGETRIVLAKLVNDTNFSNRNGIFYKVFSVDDEYKITNCFVILDEFGYMYSTNNM